MECRDDGERPRRSEAASSTPAASVREIRLTSIIDQLRTNGARHRRFDGGAGKVKIEFINSNGDVEDDGDDDGSSGADQSGAGGAGAGRQRGGRRRAPLGPAQNGVAHDLVNHNNNNNINNNNTLHGSIKNERLSPPNATDRSSSRSRSVTPSTGSFPGTPPQTGVGASGERGSSPAHPHAAALLGGAGVPPPHLAQMPHAHHPQHALAARNYSDFMRSLAAKYNSPNSAEFFSAAARPLLGGGNGSSIASGAAAGAFSPSLDARFAGALKSAAAAGVPFMGVGLLATPPVTASTTAATTTGVGRSPPPPLPPPPQPSAAMAMVAMSGGGGVFGVPGIADRPLGGLFARYSHAHGGPRAVPAFPAAIDMSSTKALLAIARVANATKEAEALHSPSYSNTPKSTLKRPSSMSEGGGGSGIPLSSPLDLSSANSYSSAAKRSRLSPKLEHESSSCGDADSDGVATPASKNGGRFGGRSASPAGSSCDRKSPSMMTTATGTTTTATTTTVKKECASGCCSGRKECGDAEMASWGVDDVCKFVESIDICAEYSPTFREQRIDGSGLPLLTEDHLTGLLRMKLGPALKMRALLAARLGACQHCKCGGGGGSSGGSAGGSRQATPTPNIGVAPASPSQQQQQQRRTPVKVERPASTSADDESDAGNVS